jgi:small subunit ribosomal protein S9
MADAPTTQTTPGGDAPTPGAAPTPAKKKSNPSDPYTWGVGRRKTAVARVRIRPGDGQFQINKRPVDKFFALDCDRGSVRTPLRVTQTADSVDVFVNVRGGGVSGQAGAVVLGLARALARYNADLEPKLRENHLLSRDSRKVERKKYGQRGARRRFQFSKR